MKLDISMDKGTDMDTDADMETDKDIDTVHLVIKVTSDTHHCKQSTVV